MTEDRDPMLQAMFEAAAEEFPRDDFVAGTMAGIDRQRRRTMLAWLLSGLALVLMAWLAAEPLIDVVNLFSQVLPQSLVDIDNELASRVVAPINSISGAVGGGFLALWLLYRKIFL